MRSSHDRGVIAALALLCVAFLVAVALARPAARDAVVSASDVGVASAAVPRGAVLHPLALPADAGDVDLGVLPERLANEAAPNGWRRVVIVRGIPGLASEEGVAVISWSEKGIVYWLSSPTHTTAELVVIADAMR